MEDLINKNMFKVMSVLSQYEIIWDMEMECEIPRKEKLYKGLEKVINIEEWVREYYSFYKKWLYEDMTCIYDISSPINQMMINAIISYNNSNDNKLLYWFDVDRDVDEQFKWKLCPLSGTELIRLGDNYHPNNRLISSVYPLVFPG